MLQGDHLSLGVFILSVNDKSFLGRRVSSARTDIIVDDGAGMFIPTAVRANATVTPNNTCMKLLLIIDDFSGPSALLPQNVSRRYAARTIWKADNIRFRV